MQVELSMRQTSHLLAALRNWQTDSLNEDLPEAFATYFGDAEPLDDDQIDALCEQLIVAEGQAMGGGAY